MNDYKFGNFLCGLRETKGMTQLEIANMLGVTTAAVTGTGENPEVVSFIVY